MPITCQECGQEFPRLITSTHLKRHGMTTAQYRDRYGPDSLASPEYRAERSAAVSGENNPNHGNKWTDEQKQSLSEKKRGSTPWNKGIRLEDTTVYREAAKKREERYRRGEIQRGSVKWSQEDRERISEQVRDYARANPESMRERAQKSVETRLHNGYFEQKRLATTQKDIDTFASYGFAAKPIDRHRVYHVECNTCQTQFVRGQGQWHDRMCPGCGRENSTSQTENEIYQFVIELVGDRYDVYQSDRTLLHPFEIDILIPQLKMGIEFNGLYWHSEEAGKSQWYHRTKLEKCNSKGYRLIQIFEDEWLAQQSKVKDRLRHKLGMNHQGRVFARACEVRAISAKVAFDFFEETHLQGRGYGSHFFGLYHQDQLVACMSFAGLNRAKGFRSAPENAFELNRFSSRIPVVGGASRLFRAFVNGNTTVQSVISYADLRWNDGSVYAKLGFEQTGRTTPGYWYVKGTDRIHRYKLRKTATDPPDKTEKELRSQEGYLRIWDCGHARWVWTREKAQ